MSGDEDMVESGVSGIGMAAMESNAAVEAPVVDDGDVELRDDTVKPLLAENLAKAALGDDYPLYALSKVSDKE